MSKKRTKNARKKVVRKKALAAPRPEARASTPAPLEPEAPSPVAPAWTPAPQEVGEPSQESVTVKDGGGAIETFRTRLTPGAGRDGDTLLTKRRSLGELSLWLAGAWALLWLLWKLVQALNPPV